MDWDEEACREAFLTGLIEDGERAVERTEYLRDRYRQRVVVEHWIARLVHLGIRQSRYSGKGKTLFQVVMAATVANLTLIASHMAGKAILNDSGGGEGALLSIPFAILAGLGAVGAAVRGLLTALGEPQPLPAAAASIPLHPPRSPYQLSQTPPFRPGLYPLRSRSSIPSLEAGNRGL